MFTETAGHHFDHSDKRGKVDGPSCDEENYSERNGSARHNLVFMIDVMAGVDLPASKPSFRIKRAPVYSLKIKPTVARTEVVMNTTRMVTWRSEVP